MQKAEKIYIRPDVLDIFVYFGGFLRDWLERYQFFVKYISNATKNK